MVIFHPLESIIKNKFGIKQYPCFVTFLITWRCNARCSFCDIWKKKNDAEEMTLEEIKNVFNQLKRIDVLRLTGGEPFLRNDLAEIINTVDKINKPSIIHLTSNGILTEQIISTMTKIKSLKKIHIKISIDNMGEKHNQHRGVPGAYEKAKATVEKLAKLRDKFNFHVGINHVILDEREIDTFFEIKKIFNKINVPVYASVGIESKSLGIYTDSQHSDPKMQLLKSYSKEGAKKIADILVRESGKGNNLAEKILDKYNVRGMYNRIVENRNVPNPKCVALNNHLRILPNGDVPVCILNGTVVGNLKKQKFKDVWFSKEAEKQNQWVEKCPGCWQTCETGVSAIYTGDIWKGLFY